MGRRRAQGSPASTRRDPARGDAHAWASAELRGSGRNRSAGSTRRARGGRGTAMTAARPPLLVTGSSGLLGSVLAARLRSRFEIRGLDRVPPHSSAAPEGGTRVVSTASVEDVAAAAAGAAAIVHLAGAAALESTWGEVLADNIDLTRVVLDGAVSAGVERVVLASSNHVTGLFERDQPYRDALDGRHERRDRTTCRYRSGGAAPAGQPLRRQQGRRRGARPDVRRAARPAGRLPSHRLRARERRATRYAAGGRRGAVDGTSRASWTPRCAATGASRSRTASRTTAGGSGRCRTRSTTRR